MRGVKNFTFAAKEWRRRELLQPQKDLKYRRHQNLREQLNYKV
ncbi:MAG: hypothetical protein WB443_11775 [Nitrososphaeraceae archaeon]